MRKSLLLAVAAVALTSACYRLTVVTGAPAAATPAVDVQWAHGFVYGLVPVTPINVATQCPQGIAAFRTEQTFVNGLAQGLTWNLYNPQHITITCATGPVRSSAVGRPSAAVALTPPPAAPAPAR